MKRFVVYLFSTIAFLSLSAQTMYICKGTSYTIVTGSVVGDMTYSENGNNITVNGTTYSVDGVDSILFSEPKFSTSSKLSHDTVWIAYQGSSVSVSKNNDSILVSANAAHVTVTSSVVGTEITYLLSGNSSDGSLTINGNYKLTLALKGLSLTNSTGSAIDVECGKRIAVTLADGTTNTLIDGTGGSQKACFYVKGHAEISGAGTLALTGNTKHAFSSKEYLELKSSAGSILVNSAVGDGLHCGQYFEMNGGTVTVANTKGDCIDADDLGNVKIKGGTLNLTVSADDTKGINCDSTFTQSGGDISLIVPTASSQGIKLGMPSSITGGTITGNISGAAAKCIKAGSILTITGGTLTANMYGAPIVTDYDPSYSTGVKCDANLNVTGGTFTMNCYGVASRGFSVDGTGTFNGGTYTITTTGAAGSYTASSGTDYYSCKCITSDGALSILGGTYTLKSTGTAGKCITTDGVLTIGNSVGVGLSSMTSNPYISCTTTGSKYGSSTSSAGGPGGGGGWNPGGGGGGQTTTDGSSAKTIKALGAIVINDGYIAVNTATDGAEGIESKSSITINNGQIIANCYDDCINSSGIIKFNGGFTYCKGTGNDGIDSNYGKAGAITITGGVVLGLSFKGSPEEGMDCDADYIVLSGGYVFSSGGSMSSYPSGISSATQPAAMLASLSLTNGSYYTLECNGTNLWTIKMPASFSGSYSMVSAPGMLTGKSCHFYSGTTAPTSSTSSYNNCFRIAPTVTTSTTMKTWTQSSSYLKI